MAYRFKVALNPSIRKRLSGAAARSVRGFTTVSRKTANVLKKANVTGQLRYDRKGYVTLATGRLPKSLVRKAAFKSGKLPKIISLHRLAYAVETGKNLTKFRGKKFGNAIVVDHKNTIRDYNTAGNLRPMTNRANTARISKKTYQKAIRQGNKTVRIKTGGTFQNSGQQALQTKLKTIGRKGLRAIARKATRTKVNRYGADVFSRVGRKSFRTFASRVGESGVRSLRKRVAANLKARLGAEGVSALRRKGSATRAKKDPNYFKKVSAIRLNRLRANPKLASKATLAARARLKQLNKDPAYRARRSAAIRAALRKRKR